MECNRIFAEYYGVKDPKKFELLMEHVPANVRRDLYDYYPEETIFASQLSSLDSCKIYTELNIYEISKVALLAYRINKISFEALITVFMNLGVLEEFSSNPSVHSQFFFGKDNYTHSASLRDITNDFAYKYPTPIVYFLSSNYTRRMSMSMKGIDDNYLNNLPQKKLDFPYLKEFLALDDSEWLNFITMLKDKGSENLYSLITPPVRFGSWSLIYEHMRDYLRCFKPIKFYKKPKDVNGAPKIFKYLILPSFTMVQAFLKVKAITNGIKWMEFVPLFGKLSNEEIYRLNTENKTPLSLFCPTNNSKDTSTLNGHLKAIDSLPCGPYSSCLYDLASGLRWQEMDVKTVKGVLRIIWLLDNYSLNISTQSEKYKQILEFRNLLMSQIHHSFSPKSSLYKNPTPFAENFGRLFKNETVCNDELLDFIFFDMIKNEIFWKQNLNIDMTDLFQTNCLNKFLALRFLLQDLPAPTSLTLVKNFVNDSVYKNERVKFVNSECKILLCEVGFIVNSTLSSIFSSHRIYMRNCQKMNDMQIEAKKGSFYEECTLKKVSIGKVEVVDSNQPDTQFLMCTAEGLELSCPAEFVKCIKLTSISSNNHINVKMQKSINCTDFNASQINWKCYEDKLHFEKFNCKEFNLDIRDCLPSGEIVFSNCSIQSLRFIGKEDDFNKVILLFKNPSSIIEEVYYIIINPITGEEERINMRLQGWRGLSK